MEQLLDELCAKTGYTTVTVQPGIIRAVSTGVAAPYLEGSLTDVLRRLIRLARLIPTN